MSKNTKISVNVPGLAAGKKVRISGLGSFTNGEETEVTGSQIENFENVNGTSFTDSIGRAEGIEIVTGSKRGSRQREQPQIEFEESEGEQ